MNGFVLRASTFDTALRVRFGHSSAVRERTQTVLVAAVPDGPNVAAADVGVGEACPREYVTGETVGSVLTFLGTHKPDLEQRVATLDDLRDWLGRHEAEIDENPAAFAAIEGALVDLFAKRRGLTTERALNLPDLDAQVEYSAVLGDARPLKFWFQALLYWLAGFRDFKVKISGDLRRDRRKLAIFKALGRLGALRLRGDANNLWPDAQACLRFIRELGMPFWAIEEPVGAGDTAAQGQIARDLGVKVILDESLLRTGQLTDLAGYEHLVVANVRVSKNGGILRSIAIARRAADLGVPVILGAHVGETSVLTRAALTVASGVRDKVVAREGGFGLLLLKRDAVSPSLVFGLGGVLRPGRFLPAEHYGNGLTLAPDILLGMDDPDR